MDTVAASVGDVGDTGDSKRHVGEIGGVLLVVEEAPSLWRSASCPCSSEVTYELREKEKTVKGND